MQSTIEYNYALPKNPYKEEFVLERLNNSSGHSNLPFPTALLYTLITITIIVAFSIMWKMTNNRRQFYLNLNSKV